MCENKIRNWRIVAGILVLLLVQAVLGRMDSEAKLEEVERLASLHAVHPQSVPSTSSGRTDLTGEGQAKPLQRQASINRISGGVL